MERDKQQARGAMRSRTFAQVSAWMSMWLGPHSGHWSVIWTTIERPLGSGLQDPGLSPSCRRHKSVEHELAQHGKRACGW